MGLSNARQPARGQTLANYGLILALIAAVAISAVAVLGGTVNGIFGTAAGESVAGGGGGETYITGDSPQPGTGGPLAVHIANFQATGLGDGNVRIQADGEISGGTFVQFGWYAYAGSFTTNANTISVDFQMSCADLSEWMPGEAPMLGLSATDYPSEEDWQMAMNMGDMASDQVEMPFEAEVAGC